MKTQKILPFLLLFIVFFAFMQSVAAEELVVVNFYYSASCSSCDAYKPIIHQVEVPLILERLQQVHDEGVLRARKQALLAFNVVDLIQLNYLPFTKDLHRVGLLIEGGKEDLAKGACANDF